MMCGLAAAIYHRCGSVHSPANGIGSARRRRLHFGSGTFACEMRPIAGRHLNPAWWCCEGSLQSGKRRRRQAEALCLEFWAGSSSD